MSDFSAIHIRPWLIAGRDFLPRRTICNSSEQTERAMHILGLTISVDRDASSAAKWTRRSLAMAAVTGTVLSTGVAFAFWSTTGSGASTAAARTFVAPTVAAGAAPTAQLYPGLTADGSSAGGDLVLSVSNSNPFPVTITGISAGSGNLTVSNSTKIGSETQAQADAACQASPGVQIFAKTNPTVTYPNGSNIPKNSSNVAVTISKVVTMTTASVSECQGATFTFASDGVSLSYTSA